VKSDTQSSLGRLALNCRLTRSRGQDAAVSGVVVRTRLPQRAPAIPRLPISRSTVHRAPRIPSRFICFQTLSAPSTWQLACGLPVITRRGDRQNPADRLDPERVAVVIDDIDQDLSRRSSSAWAKNALASLRMSLARRSALIRSRSSVFRPSRTPVSPLRQNSCRL
jgi:hypothetical protein